MTEPSDHHDISEPAAIAELVLNADPTEATDPMLRADPTEPMLSTDPWEAMLNMEPSDQRDHFEPTIAHLRDNGTTIRRALAPSWTSPARQSSRACRRGSRSPGSASGRSSVGEGELPPRSDPLPLE